MRNDELTRIDDLTDEEFAAIATATLLHPPVPSGHLYLYRAEVANYVLRYRGQRNSITHRLINLACTDVSYIARACNIWWQSLKRRFCKNLLELPEKARAANKATILFFGLLLIATVIVFVHIVYNIGIPKHSAQGKEVGKLLETFGNVALALGAIWTSSGVILSNREMVKFSRRDEKTSEEEALKILTTGAAAASKRAWDGVGLLLFGVALILLKVWGVKD
ncbi:hypothetical protein ACN9M1_24575 [Ralstonia sp. R-29]|uniref:hypothetical protein n=1 Tax=Ralstonia sp. R-29 TaxID=3404059 RepID=UPI003CEB4FE6